MEYEQTDQRFALAGVELDDDIARLALVLILIPRGEDRLLSGPQRAFVMLAIKRVIKGYGISRLRCDFTSEVFLEVDHSTPFKMSCD
ncbi:hypothetical protein D3C86_1678290 [compost metagenome]